MQTPTTLILLRHGVTDNTVAKLFCGSGGSDPGLNDEGHAQADRAAAYLRRAGASTPSSPLRCAAPRRPPRWWRSSLHSRCVPRTAWPRRRSGRGTG
ncbi:MAG: histidine phosphatase family protein [Nocardioidaceae bacterium]